MDLDYTEYKNVKIFMIKYLMKLLTAFPEEITTTAETPAAEYLFKIPERVIAKAPPE